MREWQYLLHRWQVWTVAACSVRVNLRAALFFLWQSVRSCSACFVPDCTAAHQESRHSARLSHGWMPITEHFMSLLQVSLYLSPGRPLDLAPDASSPYSRSLGMRPSSMRWMWPSYQMLHWLRRVKMMEGRPAHLSTLVMGTLSRRLILRMHLRHRRWNLFSFFSWAEYVDHASLQYRRVHRTQALYSFIFVFSVRLLLDHTLLWSLDITTAAFAILLLISGSKDMLELMIDPRY